MSESTIVSTIAAFISQVGFPIFVAVYVLMRLEPTINKLNDTISVLTIITAKQSGIDYEQVIGDYRVNGGGK
jgi:hypothetical protein